MRQAGSSTGRVASRHNLLIGTNMEAQLESPDVTVVIMAFNEAENIDTSVEEIHAGVSALGCAFEMLIVNDGSSDATGERADGLAARLPHVRVIHHPVNQGLGGVYRTGFSHAAGRYLTFYPADGQFPPSIIGLMLPLMSQYEMVLGYLPDRRPSAVGRALSSLERLLYRGLFGPMPRFQGVLMFRRELLERFPLASAGRGWAVLMELILRAHRTGCRMISVPTQVRPRIGGHSKVNNFRTIQSNLRQVLQLRRELEL